MPIEKFELPHYYKPERFMKPKFKSEKKKRKCMMCKKEFISDWIGNRICNPCKLTDTWKSGNCYIQPILTLAGEGVLIKPDDESAVATDEPNYLVDEEFDDL